MKRLKIDADYLVEVLLRLLAVQSPSGYTDNIVHETSTELERLKIPFELTRRGAIRAHLEGKQRTPDRAIIAHLDTLGAMVKGLKDNGRLEVVPVGTWSPRFAEGARVTIICDGGVTHRGTILPLKASGHVFGRDIDTQPVRWVNLEIRVDREVGDREGLERLGVNVGDFVAIDTNPEIVEGFINSRHLDDKAGVAAMLAAARAITEAELALPVDCHLLFTISEEVGVGASHVLHGDVAEMVSIDNGTIAPGQNTSEYGVTIAMQDSSGPFDWHLSHLLLELCAKYKIEHARDVFRYYRSDAASAIEAGNDIRTALVCFALDGSHGYERTNVRSLVALAELLSHYMQCPLAVKRDVQRLGPIEGFPTQPQPP